MKRGQHKKGVSPVVATTLLIVLVIVLAIIVFLWVRGFIEEPITKGNQNIKILCENVLFEAAYSESSEILSINNVGNIAIYSFKLKVEKDRAENIVDISEISTYDWPEFGLNIGGGISGEISSVSSGAQAITLIPVLIGTTGDEKKTYTCEDQYGKKIFEI